MPKFEKIYANDGLFEAFHAFTESELAGEQTDFLRQWKELTLIYNESSEQDPYFKNKAQEIFDAFIRTGAKKAIIVVDDRFKTKEKLREQAKNNAFEYQTLENLKNEVEFLLKDRFLRFLQSDIYQGYKKMKVVDKQLRSFIDTITIKVPKQSKKRTEYAALVFSEKEESDIKIAEEIGDSFHKLLDPNRVDPKNVSKETAKQRLIQKLENICKKFSRFSFSKPDRQLKLIIQDNLKGLEDLEYCAVTKDDLTKLRKMLGGDISEVDRKKIEKPHMR